MGRHLGHAAGSLGASRGCEMAWLVTKYLITAVIVVVVSEVDKHSDRLGAMIAALPIVTLLTLIWLYAEGQPASKISNHRSIPFGM